MRTRLHDGANQLKIQDIHPFGVRMPEELKKRLADEARTSGKSLNSEVVERLQASVAKQHAAHYRTEEGVTGYVVPLSDAERQMLAVFRRLPAEKQLALISLFK